jgi:hypothetical protein
VPGLLLLEGGLAALAERLELLVGSLALRVDRGGGADTLGLDLLDAAAALRRQLFLVRGLQLCDGRLVLCPQLGERLVVVRPQRPKRLLCARALSPQGLLGGVLGRGQDALVLRPQRLERFLALALG